MADDDRERCATCHRQNDVANMHIAEVELLVGITRGQSTSSRRGNRHSMGYGGGPTRFNSGYSNSNSTRASKRERTKIERVWVCDDCKDPASYGDGGRKLIRIAIVLALLWFGGSMALSYISDAVHQLSRHSPFAAVTKSVSRSMPAAVDQPSPDEPTAAPKSRVKFATRHEVVQALPATSNDYPPCSATVTDHCTGN